MFLSQRVPAQDWCSDYFHYQICNVRQKILHNYKCDVVERKV